MTKLINLPLNSLLRFKFNSSISYFSWFILSLSEIIYLCYYNENIHYKFHITFYISFFNKIIAETYYERVTLYLWFNNLYFNELPNLFSLMYCLQLDFIYFRKYSRRLIHLVDIILHHRIYTCLIRDISVQNPSFIKLKHIIAVTEEIVMSESNSEIWRKRENFTMKFSAIPQLWHVCIVCWREK